MFLIGLDSWVIICICILAKYFNAWHFMKRFTGYLAASARAAMAILTDFFPSPIIYDKILD